MNTQDKSVAKRARKEAKELKRSAKKAMRKSEARTKTRMEIVRTFGSAGSFLLGAAAFLRAYQII